MTLKQLCLLKARSVTVLGTILFMGLALSACSQSAGNMGSSQAQNEVATPAGIEHTHPANKCTNSISHSHPGGGKPHKHNYDCSPKNYTPPKSVAHTHPAQKCTRSVSHSHPNGGKKHSHHYNCNSKARTAGAHTHPVNKCTRSTTHSHPNGKRKHSHHYSCKGYNNE